MKKYMGDGVYAEWTADNRIILTTENGISITNTIVIERDVWHCLKLFVERNEP